MKSRLWTPEAETKLKELWQQGLSASEIRKNLGPQYTTSAIIGKKSRLGLEVRPSPIGFGAATQGRGARGVRGTHRTRWPKEKEEAPLPPLPEVQPPPVVARVAPTVEPKRNYHLAKGHTTCRLRTDRPARAGAP